MRQVRQTAVLGLLLFGAHDRRARSYEKNTRLGQTEPEFVLPAGTNAKSRRAFRPPTQETLTTARQLRAVLSVTVATSQPRVRVSGASVFPRKEVGEILALPGWVLIMARVRGELSDDAPERPVLGHRKSWATCDMRCRG